MVTATASPRKTTFNGLRDFLAVLEERNLVRHITVPVEKDWEVGAICRENFDREGESFPPSADPSPEQIERVRRRWREYGFLS